jgi:hypothetical protein
MHRISVARFVALGFVSAVVLLWLERPGWSRPQFLWIRPMSMSPVYGDGASLPPFFRSDVEARRRGRQRGVCEATFPGQPWWQGGDVVLSIFRCGAREVVCGFTVLLAVKCGADSPLVRLPWWRVQEGKVGFNLPGCKGFQKELFSSGLLTDRFRHPARLNGCSAAAQPRHQLCIGIPCSPHQVVRLWWWVCKPFSEPRRRSGGGGTWRTWSRFKFCSRVPSAKL